MTQPNFSIGDTTPQPAVQRSALVVPADTLFDDPPRHRDEPAAADASLYLRGSYLHEARDLELAYGCVDWFIYVTDSVSIGDSNGIALIGQTGGR